VKKSASPNLHQDQKKEWHEKNCGADQIAPTRGRGRRLAEPTHADRITSRFTESRRKNFDHPKS
jgi:hypothetical protein